LIGISPWLGPSRRPRITLRELYRFPPPLKRMRSSVCWRGQDVQTAEYQSAERRIERFRACLLDRRDDRWFNLVGL
ncbi:MAG: hypothetical protein ACJ8EU_21755, partial [Xanthobacteraceae bacterium]